MIEDRVNEFIDVAKDADGFVFGSPVHYAAATGAITSFMDRAFFADALFGRSSFYLKPAAAIVSARRAGTTAALDQLNKYFFISGINPYRPAIGTWYMELGLRTSKRTLKVFRS